MKRYQMYLDPVDINAIDKIAELASIPRSQIVRDLISLVSERYTKLIPKENKTTKRMRHPFDKFIGRFKLGDPKAYLKVDEIYLKD